MNESTSILIIANNQAAKALDILLTSCGYIVDQAHDHIAGLAKAHNDPPEIIFLDVAATGTDRYSVARELKADPITAEVMLIMISELKYAKDRIEALQAGADDFVSRPYNSALLQTRIEICLERKRLRDKEKSLRSELQVSYEKLHRLTKLKDDLTHMIVHDLRTPLTSMLLGLKTMRLSSALDDVQEECLDIATGNGNRLVGMINDLLDIIKSESESIKLQKEEVTAQELIAAASQQVHYFIQEKNQTLTCIVADDLPVLYVDKMKIIRTIVNLLGNAGKFTPSSGTVTLAVTRQYENGDVLFTITDTGPGIPEDAQARIFEKFWQVESDQPAQVASTGLGLTFCKIAVEAHGGRIWVNSTPGEGSAFSFTLPAAVLAVVG